MHNPVRLEKLTNHLLQTPVIQTEHNTIFTSLKNEETRLIVESSYQFLEGVFIQIRQQATF